MIKLEVFMDQQEPGLKVHGRVTRTVWVDKICQIEEFVKVNMKSDAPQGGIKPPSEICVVVHPGGGFLVNHTPEGVLARMQQGEAGF